MAENMHYKVKKPKFAIFRGIGKTPAVDWMIMASFFSFLVLAAGVWTALGFIETKASLQNAPAPVSTGQAASGKTQEEQTEEVLQLYDAKSRRHLELLGSAKTDTAADKKSAPTVATTTATSSAAASVGSSATSSSASGAPAKR